MLQVRTRPQAQAYERAYDDHGTEVFRTAYAVLGDRAAAEGVTQAVFLDLRDRLGRDDHAGDDLRRSLRVAARSRAVEAWRRAGTGADLGEHEAVALAHWGGLTVDEIAGARGVAPSAVKGLMRLGLQRPAADGERRRPVDA